METNEAPPVRYSTSQCDFDWAVGGRLLIRVDGAEQKEVVEYDCEAGTVLRNKLDDDGNPQLDAKRGDILREAVRGNVTVEWRSHG